MDTKSRGLESRHLDIPLSTLLIPSKPLKLLLQPNICLDNMPNLARPLLTPVFNRLSLVVCLRPPQLRIDKRPLRTFPRLYLTLRCLTMNVSVDPLVSIYRPYLALL